MLELISRLRLLLAGSTIAATLAVTAFAFAGSDERTISFYHIHTQETLTVTYKRDGKFIPEAMEKIDWLMRDWRENKSTKIDPNTVDIIWEMHRELGSKEPVSVICGYRSRGTNDMLRRTVGGQANNSQHITGKAIDIAFPDVPARQLRYSAMIRERGGVGYYPTSGIPFVHVDTARVRHWPNMPRDELALLFPSGRTQHHPADGGSISPADVARARKRSPEVAQQLAAYFALRDHTATPVMVADARSTTPAPSTVPAPVPKPAIGTAKLDDKFEVERMALAAPVPPPERAPPREAAPKLVAAPQLIERPSRFVSSPNEDDRSKLNELVTLASAEVPGPPASVKAPPPITQAAAAKDSAAPKAAAKPTAFAVASLAPVLPPLAPPVPAHPPSKDIAAAPAPSAAVAPEPAAAPQPDGQWAQAPEYDDDHPEELSYRPFPLAPLLTETASADDAALSGLVHPDVAKTMDVLDDVGEVLPMRLRPGRQLAELMWSKEFRGQAVNIAQLTQSAARAEPPSPVADRLVKTSSR